MPAKGFKRNPEREGTREGLAQRLKISAASLTVWQKLEGAPQDWDFEAWSLFVRKEGLGGGRSEATQDKNELQKEKLRSEIELNRLKIAKENKSVVSRSEVDALFLHVATMQKTMLFPFLTRELPPKAQGRSAEEIAALGQEFGERMCDVMTQTFEAWKAQ